MRPINYLLERESLRPVKEAVKSGFPAIAKLASKLLRTRNRHAAMQQPFQRIYETNGWEGDESVSGLGSSLGQTAVLRGVLPTLLKELDVRILLDAPCGDHFWMKELDLDLEYIGVDIVPEIIKQNQLKYQGPRKKFLVRNITLDRLPHADCIQCRDCLDHLSFEDALGAVRNLKRTGAKYLLATTYVDRTHNDDIRTGQWRPTNLLHAPFSFPPPIQLFNEQCTEEGGKWRDKSLGLWRLQDVQLPRG